MSGVEAGIVIVWCTNAQRHIESLKSAVENVWGLRVSAQWFWLKVTRSGEPVTPLDPRQSKLPYERILLVERVPSDPVVKSDGRVIIRYAYYHKKRRKTRFLNKMNLNNLNNLIFPGSHP